MFKLLNRLFTKAVTRQNDTARAVLVGRDLLAQLPGYNVFVDTYRTPAGRVFTKTVKEGV